MQSNESSNDARIIKTTRVIWGVMLLTQLLMGGLLFLPGGEAGLPVYVLFWLGLALGTVGLVLAKSSWLKSNGVTAMRRYILTLALCETPTLLGVFLHIATGSGLAWYMIPFGTFVVLLNFPVSQRLLQKSI